MLALPIFLSGIAAFALVPKLFMLQWLIHAVRMQNDQDSQLCLRCGYQCQRTSRTAPLPLRASVGLSLIEILNSKASCPPTKEIIFNHLRSRSPRLNRLLASRLRQTANLRRSRDHRFAVTFAVCGSGFDGKKALQR